MSESCSVMSDSVISWTAACQAPLSMEFSWPEYWSGFPSPGNLPKPGIEARSPALQADSLLTEPAGKPLQILPIFKRYEIQTKFYPNLKTGLSPKNYLKIQLPKFDSTKIGKSEQSCIC